MPRYARPSTRSGANASTLKAARRGQQLSPSEARTIVFSPGDHRKPVTVTLQLMPGSEPWVRITRDRATVKMPATLYVWELLLLLHGWESSRH